jgi:hypothetical protein
VSAPRVTVAIPLHRSAPFVEVVLDNIAAIDLPDAEILVSDRTVLDDAAATIAESTRHDLRVQVVAEPLGLSWTEHHRLLLHEARGRYFLWMSHDDDFPHGYVAALVERLETSPELVMAFGDLVWGMDPGVRLPDPPVRFDGPRWGAADAARFFAYGTIGRAYRGAFDRERVLAAGIVVRDLPNDSAWADELFMLEVTLLGRPAPVTDAVSYKRLHEGNTHARWYPGPWRTFRFHLRAAAAVLRHGRDRSVPLAVVLVGRHWLASVRAYLRRRRIDGDAASPGP